MDEDDVVVNYEGQVDDGGEPHGRGTAHLESGAIFRGRFHHGLPQGRGSMERPDGSTQTGNYIEGELEGRGVYDFPGGQTIAFQYCGGTMHGPFEERAADGSLRCRGTMQNDIRAGMIEFWYEDGGHLQGHVDDEGQVTGDSVWYSYPDGKSHLRGRWSNERMVSAVFETELAIRDAQVQVKRSGRGRLNQAEVAEMQPPLGVTFAYDPGNAQNPSSQPLLRDPYEAWRVEVRPSPIGGRIGEGLFARRDLAAGEVASFYAGQRCTHAEVDSRDWDANDNTMSLDADTVIDVSAEFVMTSQYCATLGHKANHSFTPNARCANN